MMIEKRSRFCLVMAVFLAALFVLGCNTGNDDDDEPGVPNHYPGLDWSKIVDVDVTDSTVTLGTAARDIDATGIRYGETALGNLIVDGIAAYAEHVSGKPVDFAMLNGQNVQGLTTISAGVITLTNLSSGLTDTLWIVTYTGSDIEKIINIFVNSSSSGRWNANCAVLVSKGVSYAIQPDTDASKPPRAVDIRLNGSPLDPKKDYRVAVGNFMAGRNGNSNDVPTSGGPSNFTNYGKDRESQYADENLKTAVAKYIAAKGTIEPVVEGRIKAAGVVPVIPATP
ncbi:MAG: 5'-nucleotidase C-terminal domain-containing protein [Spirochaetaceae bacterium]|jgi:2',3'-cyclic-nucleotide 2'-phosphodiesterase (5'-nucleotidase family)|nr:5'-nucleotidase C-terminal domain-containing protein [Spirochaetaceae bacterium]